MPYQMPKCMVLIDKTMAAKHSVNVYGVKLSDLYAAEKRIREREGLGEYDFFFVLGHPDDLNGFGIKEMYGDKINNPDYIQREVEDDLFNKFNQGIQRGS